MADVLIKTLGLAHIYDQRKRKVFAYTQAKATSLRRRQTQ